MFGGSLLVAPKITAPTAELESKKMQKVNYLLPDGELWYNFFSNKLEETTGVW